MADHGFTAFIGEVKARLDDETNTAPKRDRDSCDPATPNDRTPLGRMVGADRGTDAMSEDKPRSAPTPSGSHRTGAQLDPLEADPDGMF